MEEDVTGCTYPEKTDYVFDAKHDALSLEERAMIISYVNQLPSKQHVQAIQSFHDLTTLFISCWITRYDFPFGTIVHPFYRLWHRIAFDRFMRRYCRPIPS